MGKCHVTAGRGRDGLHQQPPGAAPIFGPGESVTLIKDRGRYLGSTNRT